MNLFTEVNFPTQHRRINYDSKSVFVGSCFSQNIGGWLSDLKFDVSSNPLGITYNPISIARQIDRALAKDKVEESELIETLSGFAHFDYHSALNRDTRDAYLKNINKYQSDFSGQLAEANFLFLTFGTSVVFDHIESGQIVNNCHKLPNKQFQKRILDESMMLGAMANSIETLQKQNPGIDIICTVSPIRHLRNGAMNNMRSKARLIRLCEMLENEFENCSYLPVYELVMDQMRDYRFYRSDDMIHLNELGTSIIKEKFTETLIHPSTHGLMKRVEKWQNMKNHIVMQPGSDQARAFQEKLDKEENNLKRLLPGRF